ncbi:hypothetical protein B2J88_48990 [Rhodococcus sp. SRB_17]|nr:hypothetical protein [Rhodococcus sp. SRB_17]
MDGSGDHRARVWAKTGVTSRSEYDLRRRNIFCPLADVCGPAGRTRAVAVAIRTALANLEGARHDRTTDSVHSVENAGCLSHCGDAERQIHVAGRADRYRSVSTVTSGGVGGTAGFFFPLKWFVWYRRDTPGEDCYRQSVERS